MQVHASPSWQRTVSSAYCGVPLVPRVCTPSSAFASHGSAAALLHSVPKLVLMRLPHDDDGAHAAGSGWAGTCRQPCSRGQSTWSPRCSRPSWTATCCPTRHPSPASSPPSAPWGATRTRCVLPGCRGAVSARCSSRGPDSMLLPGGDVHVIACCWALSCYTKGLTEFLWPSCCLTHRAVVGTTFLSTLAGCVVAAVVGVALGMHERQLAQAAAQSYVGFTCHCSNSIISTSACGHC